MLKYVKINAARFSSLHQWQEWRYSHLVLFCFVLDKSPVCLVVKNRKKPLKIFSFGVQNQTLQRKTEGKNLTRVHHPTNIESPRPFEASSCVYERHHVVDVT